LGKPIFGVVHLRAAVRQRGVPSSSGIITAAAPRMYDTAAGPRGLLGGREMSGRDDDDDDDDDAYTRPWRLATGHAENFL